MNAMKLNAICLKWLYSTWFQSVFKILASRRKWWGEEQGAKGWFCFVLRFLLDFLLKIVLWEWVCPWQRRDECSTGSIRHYCQNAHPKISYDTQLSDSQCCDRRKACKDCADTKYHWNAWVFKISHLDWASLLLSSHLIFDAEVKEHWV